MEILIAMLCVPGGSIQFFCFSPSSVIMYNQFCPCCCCCYILDFILSRSCMNSVLAQIGAREHFLDFLWAFYLRLCTCCCSINMWLFNSNSFECALALVPLLPTRDLQRPLVYFAVTICAMHLLHKHIL